MSKPNRSTRIRKEASQDCEQREFHVLNGTALWVRDDKGNSTVTPIGEGSSDA